MNYSKINEVLKNLHDLRKNKVEKFSGESDEEHYEICATEDQNVFVKLKIEKDSYGDNEAVTGIEFVKPSEKRVINYQPLS